MIGQGHGKTMADGLDRQLVFDIQHDRTIAVKIEPVPI